MLNQTEGLNRLAVILQDLTSYTRIAADQIKIREYPSGKKWSVDQVSAAYLKKMIIHSRTVITLLPSVDTQLICRTMLEGLALLRWIHEDAPTRSKLWVDHEHISAKQKVDILTRNGRVIATADEIERRAKAVGKKYEVTTRKNETKLRVDWQKAKIHEVFSAAKLTSIYERSYAGFSEWHHWSHGGFAGIVHYKEQQVFLEDQPPGEAVLCASLANFSLVQTGKLVFRYFGLDDSKLLEFEKSASDILSQTEHTSSETKITVQTI